MPAPLMKPPFLKSILTLLTTFLIAGLAFASKAATNYWNATAEFSTNSNPNDVWSYGYFTNGLSTDSFGTFTQRRGTGGDGPAWYNSAVDTWIWLNDSGTTRYGVPTGWLSLSPNTAGDHNVVLRWTAPTGVVGLVRVSGQFLAGDSGVQSLEIFSGASRGATNVLWSGSDSGSFDFTVNVNEGDVLNFANFGNFLFGNTPIQLEVTQVPEPSASALLLGAGALAAAFARRKCRKG